MSNPQAIGYIDESGTFRGVSVNYGLDSVFDGSSGYLSDVEEWLGGAAFQDTIEDLIEGEVGFSTVGRDVDAYSESTPPVIVENFLHRTREQLKDAPTWVGGFWEVEALEIDTSKEYQEYLDSLDEGEEAMPFDEFEAELEHEIGIIGEELTFSFHPYTTRMRKSPPAGPGENHEG